MKALPAWVSYSVLRLLFFAIPLAILLLLQITWWIALVAAALIGLCLSYIFLRSPRDRVAQSIYLATHRDAPVTNVDDETEDAAVDAAAGAGRPAESEPTAPERAGSARSEGERDSEQDAIGQPGEAGQLQRKDELS
ncbi:MAG: DUF4229 domain-containing protein [Microbacteriaceae bacterium]